MVSSTGQPIRLARPLDWVVVADHSDGMGMAGDLVRGKPEILAYEQGMRWNKGFAKGGDSAIRTTLDVITEFGQG